MCICTYMYMCIFFFCIFSHSCTQNYFSPARPGGLVWEGPTRGVARASPAQPQKKAGPNQGQTAWQKERQRQATTKNKNLARVGGQRTRKKKVANKKSRVRLWIVGLIFSLDLRMWVTLSRNKTLRWKLSVLYLPPALMVVFILPLPG